MRKSLAALSLALVVAGCQTAQSPSPGPAGPITAVGVEATITQVQQAAVTACGFLPVAETVLALLGQTGGTVSAIANGICGAVTRKTAARGFVSRPPTVAGVVVKGSFVR